MNAREQGLYSKYIINRVDGRDAPGGDRHGAEYFVLDTTFDPFALPALVAYANACRNEYPLLAADLDTKIAGLRRAVAEKLSADSEYITVPGRTLANGIVVDSFEIMKYPAAQGEGGVPLSLPHLKPWTRLSFFEAGEVAEKSGLNRVKESQALALIADIIEQPENWTGGEVGKGRLYGGLHKNTVSEPQAGNYEPADPEERTWYVLSNGERIYHWSGNVWEWIEDDIHGDEKGLIARKFEKGDISLAWPYPPEKKGIGWYPKNGDWSGGALIRGGDWCSESYAGPARVRDGWPDYRDGDVGVRFTKPNGR